MSSYKVTNDVYERYTVESIPSLMKPFVVMEKLTESEIEEYTRHPIDSESEYAPSICSFLDTEAVEVEMFDSSDENDTDMESESVIDYDSDATLPMPVVGNNYWDIPYINNAIEPFYSSDDSDSTSESEDESPIFRVLKKSKPLQIYSDEED